ncbi:uncharacterized protein C8A04DRAFT_29726 [Dichotomopilus funicola]|uniref:Uncharacterized protein n=1 Tax=Dichotomopilus funicola TaxID=1934379 RepID=A0AAN6V0Q8_9PEZI|nr:hypothetical protein C8A04DRAFT_29726 [Dichotomopilus funicola]
MENSEVKSEAVNGIEPDDADDVSMIDIPPQDPPQQSPSIATTPAAAATAAAAPSPLPSAHIPTPVPIPTPGQQQSQQPQVQQQQPSSRATSQHPDTMPPSATAAAATVAGGFTMPSEATPNGAPVRQYLNSKVTVVLLEGMKLVAKEQ